MPIDSPPARTRWGKSLLPCLLSVALCLDSAQVERASAPFVPFPTFLQRVKEAKVHDFLAHPGFQVKDAAAFEEMRQYLLSLYRPVHVQHSYLLGGQTFDCVPVDQQPSVRALGSNTVAPAPPATKRSPPPVMETKDELSHPVGCEEHTIPMRRITLEQLSQFRSLQEFFQKGPKSAGHTPK